jgi:hypothetical protein
LRFNQQLSISNQTCDTSPPLGFVLFPLEETERNFLSLFDTVFAYTRTHLEESSQRLIMKNTLYGTSALVASALLTGLDASSASAASKSASFVVGLTVQDTCTVTGAAPNSASSSNNLTVNCSGRTPPYVMQDGDNEPTLGKAVRTLAADSDTANYTLRPEITQSPVQAALNAARHTAGHAANLDGSAAGPLEDPPNVVTTTVVF